MRSKKKQKNKPQVRVLIIFGTGIATTISFELAMLFSHAGFDIYSIFLDDTDLWLATLPIKQLTGHSPMTASYTPGWVRKEHNFTISVVLNPDDDAYVQIVSRATENFAIQFAIDHCKNFFYALDESRKNHLNNVVGTKDIMKFWLPANKNILTDAFYTLFSKIMRFMLNQAKLHALNFGIKYSGNNDLTDIEQDAFNLLELKKVLIYKGLSFTDSQNVNLLFDTSFAANSNTCVAKQLQDRCRTESLFSLSVILLSSSHNEKDFLPLITERTVLAKKTTSREIQIYDKTGIRLFPELTVQPSVERFADYLIDKLLVNNHLLNK